MISALKLVAVIAGITLAFGLGYLAGGGDSTPVEEPEVSHTEEEILAEVHTVLPKYLFPGNLNEPEVHREIIDLLIQEIVFRDEQIFFMSDEIDRLREDSQSYE